MAGLIVAGITISAKPVGDVRFQQQAMSSYKASVLGGQDTQDGRLMVTVAWAASGRHFRGRFEANGGPPYQLGHNLQFSYDLSSQNGGFVSPDPPFHAYFSEDAALQSVVPFTLSGIALALLVIGPSALWLSGEAARRGRRSLRSSVLTPAAICAAALMAPMLVQLQPEAAYSQGDAVGATVLSWLLVLLLIWPCVGVVRHYRTVRLPTIADAPTDGDVLSVGSSEREASLHTSVVMACLECGAEVPDRSGVCTGCGAPVVSVRTEPTHG